MNRLHYLVFFSFVIISTALSAKKSLIVQNKSNHIFILKSGKTVMKISTKGGRIVSYRYDGRELLTQSTENENFGSTLWTAPQSDWGWPPYDVLDNQDYVVVEYGKGLKLISKPDPKSGFQFEKSWEVNKNQSIHIKYVIRNISTSTKSVGAWSVTRVPCDGFVFFPDGGKGKVPNSNLKLDIQNEGINWILLNKTPIKEQQKLFSTAKEGWLAFSFNGMLFIKQFPDTHPENYSPQQGEVEIYVKENKSYIELENQGNYQMLQPGESLSYVENWYLISIPKEINIISGNRELPKLVRQQFKSNK